MSMTDVMGQNTYVSNPGGNATPGYTGAPGGTGPGAGMSMASAIAWLMVGSAAVGIGTAVFARKGVKPQIGTLDVFSTVYNASTVAVVFATAKLLAYRYHGHRISQAVLLVL